MKKKILTISGPWEFREFPETARRMSDLEEGHWLKTDQPQSIFLGLAQAGILMLDDLYAQPQAFRWVGRQAWVFRTQFDVSQEQFAACRKELVFEGLDTLTQIWLNDRLLGRTDNMFMTHRFDAGSLLRPGGNTVVIQFLPAEEQAEKRVQQYGKTTGPFDISPSAYLRKAQYQFGSAMGPALPGCGIIGPVHLELTDIADITEIHLRTIDCNESFADVRAAITIRLAEQNRNKDLRCLLRIRGDGPVLSHTLEFKDQQDRLSTVLRIERPILWEPKGYGTPFRYHVSAQLYCGDILLDVKEILFGVRTVRILRPQEEESTPITLEVNQQLIQTKGVYWIPVGLLPGPDDQEKKTRLLHKLADANINLLCVWGAGGYEDNTFYDLCDQMGMLVWQEMVFPPLNLSDCSWLTNEFRREMEQLACRLRNHACLIGWCCAQSDGYPTKSPEKRKKPNSGDFFHKEMTELLNEWDSDRDCVPSFSITGAKENRNHWIQTNDWLDARNSPLVEKENLRCALPCLQTLRMTCRDEEIFPGSARVESQIYYPSAFSGPARQTELLFAPPKTIEEQIYQSQVTQGRWAKKRIESVRGGNNPYPQAMPWTAGQFWPCAGFSMADFTQRPNAIYYYAKRSFASILVCLTQKKENPQTNPSAAVILNDRPESLTGKIVFELLDMKGQILDTGEFPVFIGPHSKSTDIILPRAFLNPVFPEKSILRLAIISNEQRISENLYLFLPDKYMAFKPMEIDLTMRLVSEQTILLGLKSRYFVKDLELVPAQNASLGDNYFDLLPGRDYEVAVNFTEPVIRPDAPWILRSVCTM
jgi:beta-mannosidase